jgi:TRAP-type mannitol/chloroaromatic compound transport system permease large subunit
METIRRQQGSHARASAFRRAVLLQVYLPLAVGAFLVLGTIVVGLVAGGPGGATPRGMADVALIALLFPAMIIGVIALVGTSLLALGIARLIGWLPEWTHKAQRLFGQIADQSDRIAERVAQSVVAPKSVWAGVSAAWGRLFGKS